MSAVWLERWAPGTRAKPADHAGCFFGLALSIEGDDVYKNLFGAEVRRPSVSSEDGFIQLVMDLAKDSNQAHLVNTAIFGGQFLVGAELFEDVVHFCECERGVKLLLALAVRIKPLGDFLNDAFCRRSASGNGNGSKHIVLLYRGLSSKRYRLLASAQ